MSIDARNRGETFPMSGQAHETMGIKARFHTLLVALSFAVGGNAMAQDKQPILVASADTASTSAPASADKGGGQVLLLNDGTSITFADFGKKGPEEQEKVLGMVGVRDRIRARSWLAQVANQRKESELAGLQVANQTLIAKQKEFVASAMIYMQRVEKTKESVNLAIIQDIIDTANEAPGLVPEVLLEWAQKHHVTVTSVAGR